LTSASIPRFEGEDEVDMLAEFCICAVSEGTPVDILRLFLGEKNECGGLLEKMKFRVRFGRSEVRINFLSLGIEKYSRGNSGRGGESEL
jgi:hypothetical protein